MERANPRRLGACFALGAVTGTLLDGIHAYGDVLSYPNPAFGRWAFFVPLEFGLLGTLVGMLAPILERIAGATRAFATGERVRELALFASLYLATAIVPADWRFALAAALTALALARLARGSARGDWLYVLLAAALGPAGEALTSA